MSAVRSSWFALSHDWIQKRRFVLVAPFKAGLKCFLTVREAFCLYTISRRKAFYLSKIFWAVLFERTEGVRLQCNTLGRQEGWPTREQLIEPAIVLSKENFLNLKQRRLFLPQAISLDFFKWKLNIVISSRFKASDIKDGVDQIWRIKLNVLYAISCSSCRSWHLNEWKSLICLVSFLWIENMDYEGFKV